MRAAAMCRSGFVLVVSVLAACSAPDEPSKPIAGPPGVSRTWQVWVADTNFDWTPLGEPRHQDDGVLYDSTGLGEVVIHPRGFFPGAGAEVFSNETGETYWVATAAPHKALNSRHATGTAMVLYQESRYVIDSDNPSLTFNLTHAALWTIDGDTRVPTAEECRQNGPPDLDSCVPVKARISFRISARPAGATADVYSRQAFAELAGYVNHWSFQAYGEAADHAAWGVENFDFDPNFEDTSPSMEAAAFLNAPIAYHIPLGGMKVGDTIVVMVKATAISLDGRQLETFSSAYLRDPVDPVGMTTQSSGVRLIEPPPTPTLAELEHAPTSAPACTGSSGSGGTLQFASPQFTTDEGEFPGATITISRTGATNGVVSAVVTTGTGTATAGTDYEPIAAVVRFGDGEGGSHSVSIPIHGDAIAEANETVNLTLAGVGGCATLGAQATATLTIRDDDQPTPPPPSQFSIGGSITGLVGSGLFLRERIAGFDLHPTANGPFTIVSQQLDGSSYDVRVETQPTNPLQVCTVANGTGTLAGANVTNIAVTCTTPPPTGSLDVGFGSSGRVTSTTLGLALGMAIQSDGRIVVTTTEGKVARFNVDGSPDQSFGTNARTDFAFPSASSSVPQDVVVQPDGKIVVAGAAHFNARDDFIVARYTATGSLDQSFGTNGMVLVDFASASARAWGVALQADGSIVVAGQAAFQKNVATFDNDFAVARLTTTGALDASFGTSGKATVNIGGLSDWAYAVKVQTDGGIVLAGRTAPDGGSTPDIAVVRLTSTGAPDATFATNGVARFTVGAGDFTEEAFDLAIQPDGRIVLAGEAQVQGAYNVLVARLTTGGALDATFGANGITTTAFTTQGDQGKALALQADGKIVVAGRTAMFGTTDFGIARYTTDGVLDASFAGTGKLTIDFFTSFDGAEAVLVQPDGKIVAAGSARNGSSTGLGMVRVVP